MVEHENVVEGWHKSSMSGGGECVEVRIAPGHVQVRHTKDRTGPVLSFTYTEWRAFLTGVRLGEFDISDAGPS